jgi:hypothetical protein
MAALMGKTVGTIIKDVAIAAAVVVAIGTGIGIAAGVPLSAALEASVASLGMLTGVGATVAGAAALAGASIIAGSVLGPKLPKPDTTVTALKTALPPRVRAYGRSRLYGNYDLYLTSSLGTAVDVFSLLDTGGNAIDGAERFYLGDQQVATGAGVVTGLADGTYAGLAVEIDFRTGLATETPYSQLITLLPGIWTSNHRGDGVVTAMVTWKAVKAKNYQKTYPNGQPALSMVARWLRVFDWRDVTQSVSDPSTWKWSENAVLHLADYVLTVEKAKRATSEMFPSGAALTAAWDRYFAPTLTHWTAAADDADVAMALKGGGTEARYRGLVSHRLTDAHKDVKSRLLDCFDGWLAPREDGALIVYSGRYYTPTVEIGPDEIVSYSLQNGVEDENAVNDIAVTYLSAAHDFNTVNTNNWTDEADISARGAIRSETFSPDVPTHSQARRLTKRKAMKAMAPQRGTVTTNSAGRAARGQRFIQLLLRENGRTFYSGPAEITSLTRNLATGGVTFNWIAVTAAIDDWNPALEEGDPAPSATGVAVSDLTAPVITAASASFSQDSAANASGVRISLTIDAPDRDDLTWYVFTRTTGAATWDERTYTDLDPGPSVSIITEFVATDADIEVETAYQVGDGRFSPRSATSTVNTSTASLAPDAPAGLSATGFAGSASIDWTNSTSNFSYSRVYRGTTSSFGSAALISGDLAGGAGSTQGYTDTVAAGTYFWWVRAYSAAGAASSLSGPVSATVS